MIKNGKFFAAPQQSNENFKQLFARLAAAGAGRPVDKHGFADGPWTPEKLAEAITSMYGNQQGIELRSVQVWFQDNDNGISDQNLRWLARVFGCDDPEATSEWQAELKAAKKRLASQRRDKKLETPQVEAPDNNPIPLVASCSTMSNDEQSKQQVAIAGSGTSPQRTLAEKCENMLSGALSLNVQFGYWMAFSGLGVMNSVVGTLSVTYMPRPDLEKQVGLIWAPTLTVLPLIALPSLIFFVSNMNTYWRACGRPRCISRDAGSINRGSNASWLAKVNDFSVSFWAIVLFCFVFVFGFQWVGIYLPAYLSGDVTELQIDRYLLALVRPDVISIPEAAALAAVDYLYTASYVAVSMFGLLFSMIVTQDFEEICTMSALEDTAVDRSLLRKEGQKIIWAVFRVVVCALWIALLIKLQATYLQSDSKDILAWFHADFEAALSANAPVNGWLNDSSISSFPTFMMVVATVAIFLVCVTKVQRVSASLELCESDHLPKREKTAVPCMCLVIVLLSASIVLTGRFSGFSLLIAASVTASAYILRGPKLRCF